MRPSLCHRRLLPLLVLAACAEPAPEPGFEISVDGDRIDGSFSRDGRTVTFFAGTIADGEATQVVLELGSRRLDLVVDRGRELLTEDASGATFAAADRELLAALRDNIGYFRPEIIETGPGRILVRTADRYAEVPLGQPRFRVDTRLNTPQQEGKADLAPGACGDDGVTCLADTYGDSWAAFSTADTCEAFLSVYGDSACRGRCGFGCNWFDEDYTWDCHDHDICLDKGGNCSDEFDDAADDWVATSAPYCWGGSDRSKPTPPPPSGKPLVSALSSKCANVSDWSHDNAAGVIQYPCPLANQLWRFEPMADGSFHVVNANSGKCLEMHAESVDNGATIQQWQCFDVPQQKWQISPQGGAIALINKLSGKCLDVPGAVTDDVQLVQWDCQFGANQLWYH